jgi:hypothetical protein
MTSSGTVIFSKSVRCRPDVTPCLHLAAARLSSCHHIQSLLFVFVGLSSLSDKLASLIYFFLVFWS